MSAILGQLNRWRWVPAIPLLLLLPACQSSLNAPTLATSVNPPVAPDQTSTPRIELTSSPQPTSTLPTLTPTASPLPVHLVVPTRWASAASLAIDLRTSAGRGWLWQLSTDANPGDNITQSLADVALARGSVGVPVGQTPLALAVPFTSDWETISFAEAQRILEEGSPFIGVFDWNPAPPVRLPLLSSNKRLCQQHAYALKPPLCCSHWNLLSGWW